MLLRGLPSFPSRDPRHTLTLTVVWVLPFGKQLRACARQLGGILVPHKLRTHFNVVHTRLQLGTYFRALHGVVIGHALSQFFQTFRREPRGSFTPRTQVGEYPTCLGSTPLSNQFALKRHCRLFRFHNARFNYDVGRPNTFKRLPTQPRPAPGIQRVGPANGISFSDIEGGPIGGLPHVHKHCFFNHTEAGV